MWVGLRWLTFLALVPLRAKGPRHVPHQAKGLQRVPLLALGPEPEIDRRHVPLQETVQARKDPRRVLEMAIGRTDPVAEIAQVQKGRHSFPVMATDRIALTDLIVPTDLIGPTDRIAQTGPSTQTDLRIGTSGKTTRMPPVGDGIVPTAGRPGRL